jgi:pyrimidine operon attenuation protein / uracil phosphoribosyltransferase
MSLSSMRRLAPLNEKPSLPCFDPSQPTAVPTAKTIGSTEIQAAIQRLADGISARHGSDKTFLLIGIANGGIELARRLGQQLGVRAGTLDISFHRDDIGQHPIPKEFASTQIPADVQGATVILVDDVLFSGRTVKAALDELFDHGRPSKVELAVLADRGGRRLPMAADYVGLQVEAGEAEKVVVTLDPRDPSHDSIRVEGVQSSGARPRTV